MSHAHSNDPILVPQLAPLDDPEPGSTWFVSLAGVIILIALVVAISALAFRTEHHEFVAKVVDAGADTATLAPATPVDAESFRELERTIAARREAGSLSLAEATRLSQRLMLNAWMRYPWEDSKGQTQQLIRIPITDAMRLVVDEYAARTPPAEPRRVAAQEAATP